jgi:hypothetical protein
MTRVAMLALLFASACPAGAAGAAEPVTAGFHAPGPASAAARPARRAAPLPAANFVVEWRLQHAQAAAGQGYTITSGSAATGTSGWGPGAVTVGTARPAVPQSLRVTNGREASIVFDRYETRQVWDMAFTADAVASASTDATSSVTAGAASSASTGGASRSQSQSHAAAVQGHEVVVHRVDGLRVTPHWTSGDRLLLDVALTRIAPAAPGRDASAQSRASRDLDVRSTVEASFDEWLTLATVGDDEELQVRVTWR